MKVAVKVQRVTMSVNEGEEEEAEVTSPPVIVCKIMRESEGPKRREPSRLRPPIVAMLDSYFERPVKETMGSVKETVGL